MDATNERATTQPAPTLHLSCYTLPEQTTRSWSCSFRNGEVCPAGSLAQAAAAYDRIRDLHAHWENARRVDRYPDYRIARVWNGDAGRFEDFANIVPQTSK